MSQYTLPKNKKNLHDNSLLLPHHLSTDKTTVNTLKTYFSKKQITSTVQKMYTNLYQTEMTLEEIINFQY
jgi:hypothetical protein